MTYLELYEKMKHEGMISGSWKNLLELLKSELPDDADRDRYLKLFTLYFSLIDDGNVYMSLDGEMLEKKIDSKIDGLKAGYEEEEESGAPSEKFAAHEAELKFIKDELAGCFPLLPGMGTLPVVGETGLFAVDGNRLFTRKHFNAVRTIRERAKTIFVPNAEAAEVFDYRSMMKPDSGFRELTKGQEDILKKGVNSNLLISGGPGTGKTTSVFFLLLAVLKENPDRAVFLAAPSGKAAARMQESILDCELLVDEARKNDDIIKKVAGLEGSTIHRLLKYEAGTGGFTRNGKHRFPEGSVFVIDEGSMIDVNLFAALLDAIPDDARVFILGDRNQLPSVECGKVFSALMDCCDKKNQVELKESKRFPRDSKIFELSEAVNGGNTLPVSEEDWLDPAGFAVEEEAKKGTTPIYYYNDERVTGRTVDEIADKWFRKYYSGLPGMCKDVSPDDISHFEEIMDVSDKARILSANNEGARGADRVNRHLLKEHFHAGTGLSGFYPGEILMVIKNNHSLKIYNGDTGVAVKFKDDDSLYVMFKKGTEPDTEEHWNAIPEGKKANKVFKIGEYRFYPLHLISREEITPAFAITIHKSQGSDYGNILVLLPKAKGHPLLNRQIVYTAITRTTGNTYILSNKENLEYAKRTRIDRDTGIE